MKGLEKIGFGTIIAAAATIAAGLTYAAKEYSDKDVEMSNKSIEMRKKLEEYEQREEEAKERAEREQAKRIAELERKAEMFDKIEARKQAALEARIQELEEELAKGKKTTSK